MLVIKLRVTKVSHLPFVIRSPMHKNLDMCFFVARKVESLPLWGGFHESGLNCINSGQRAQKGIVDNYKEQ